jgi:hypothetical protein
VGGALTVNFFDTLLVFVEVWPTDGFALPADWPEFEALHFALSAAHVEPCRIPYVILGPQ